MYKRLLLLAALCSGLALQATDGNGDILPYDIHQGELENGLNVVTVPYDSPGIVSFFVVVRVGARDEVEKGVTGFAHFFEHVMFRGTKRYSKEKYNQTLQEIAAAGNANTWFDRTLYYFTGNADYLEKMFDIESDRFQFLDYSEHGFKTEAGAVLGEYTKDAASPFSQLDTAMRKTMFQKHTYGHTTIGFEADIKDMPNQFEYSKKFYDRFYRPEYCTVMVVGDTTHEQVMKLSKKYFGKWERGSYKPQIPEEPEQTAERKVHVPFKGSTNLVTVAYKSPAFSDSKKDKAALDLLMQLGFSNKSDLHRQLVQKEQKARFIYPEYYNARDPFYLGVTAQVYKEEDLGNVRDAIIATFDHFKNNPVSDDELTNIKSRLRYSFAGSLDTPLAVGTNLAYFIWLTGDPQSLNKIYRIYEQITPDDIRNMAQKYLQAEKRTVATLSAKETSP